MKKILFMLTSMNIGGVEKAFLSLLDTIPKEKFEVTLLLLEKKGGFLHLVPEWVKVEGVPWYNDIKPVIMNPPQQTIRQYVNNRQFLKIPAFIFAYILSEKIFKNRHYFYKHVFKEIPFREEEYDLAFAYQGPTDIIDFFIAHRVNAKKKISWVHFDV